MDSSLHRSADWDQHADRHTALIDPVVTVRQIGRLGLPGRTPTRIDHALVYTTARGGHEVFLPPLRPRRLRRRYTAVYEVDMGVHLVRTRLALPSDDDAHEFDAAIEFDWQVTDPGRFVRSGHRDVPRLLLGELERSARHITRRFPIAHSAAAEAEVLTAVRQAKPLGEDAGLSTTWSVRLRRDDDNIAHARRLQAIEHASAEEIRAHRCGSRADEEKAERHRAQQVQRLELLEYDAKRIAFYQEYLTRGGVDAWAMHLAQHPEDSTTALNALRDERRERAQAQMNLIKELLTKAGTEPFELEGPRRLAIEAIIDVLGQHVPASVDTPKATTAAPDAEAVRTQPASADPTRPRSEHLPAWPPPMAPSAPTTGHAR
ncbi:hypothetical protein [Streptomyces subrutilus]|uniref:hypothetical protein n=1 Tax=Streptomyces subrutilus TaxID=36818 RepID=UPI0034106676